jgi:hypothetical protein
MTVPCCRIIENVRFARLADSLCGETDNLKARIVHVGAYLDDLSTPFVTLKSPYGPLSHVRRHKSTYQRELIVEIRWQFRHLH